MKRAQLKVRGIDSACCAENIELALKVLPGVQTATVSYEAGKAIVDYEESRTNPQNFARILRESGFPSILV